MKRRMGPYLVDGLPRPDRDTRWVPVSTMAIYEGVTDSAVYARMIAGHYPPNGVRRFGRTTRYCPAICAATTVHS